MLDKTAHPATIEPVRNYAALVRFHEMIGRKLERIVEIAQFIQGKATSINQYTQTNRAEVLGSAKSAKIPGGSISYRTIAGRMSCGDHERQQLYERLKALGHHECIKYNPSLDEDALEAAFAQDPELMGKLQQEFPTFKVGEPYEQLTLEFAGMDWKVQGNTAKGDYAPVPPDRRKKK